MNAFIFDQYDSQPFHKRAFSHVLTAMGWSFWLYLWWPIFSDASDSLATGIGVLTTHGTVIGLAASLFVGWAGFRQVGTGQSIVPGGTGGQEGVESEPNRAWRRAQRMVVFHDDGSGAIEHVHLSQPDAGGAKRTAVPQLCASGA